MDTAPDDAPAVDESLRARVLEPPLLTAALPGIGGRMRACADDFVVEEIPAYPPDGGNPGAGGPTNGWLMLQLDKRGLSTEDALRILAKALGVAPSDIGFAGRKDRDARSRQWISVPARVGPRLAGLSLPDIVLGPAHAHSHKLRIGHLHGNRFDVVIRELACTQPVAEQRSAAKLAAIEGAGGLPNAFGPQRFADGGKGVGLGLAAMRGGRGGARGNMTVAAGQAALFNLYIALRAERGLLRRALVGDVLKKTETGGLFVCTDAVLDDTRLAAGEIAITGPIFGSRMMAPPQDTPAHALEREVLGTAGVDAQALGALGRAALGTRRALQVHVVGCAMGDAPAQGPLAAGLRVTFELPSGSFATALCRELQHGAPSTAADTTAADTTAAATR